MKVTILHSNFGEIIDQIENSDEVVSLVAMKCNITNIPNLPFPNLKALDLSFNNIVTFQTIPQGLIYLNLSFNLIENLNDLNLPKDLQAINLQNNPLSDITNYRGKIKKKLQILCPQLSYLDNIPIKLTIQHLDKNANKFEKSLEYTYEMFAD